MSLVRCSVRNERPEDPPGGGQDPPVSETPPGSEKQRVFHLKKKGGKGRLDPFPIWVGFW